MPRLNRSWLRFTRRILGAVVVLTILNILFVFGALALLRSQSVDQIERQLQGRLELFTGFVEDSLYLERQQFQALISDPEFKLSLNRVLEGQDSAAYVALSDHMSAWSRQAYVKDSALFDIEGMLIYHQHPSADGQNQFLKESRLLLRRASKRAVPLSLTPQKESTIWGADSSHTTCLPIEEMGVHYMTLCLSVENQRALIGTFIVGRDLFAYALDADKNLVGMPDSTSGFAPAKNSAFENKTSSQFKISQLRPNLARYINVVGVEVVGVERILGDIGLILKVEQRVSAAFGPERVARYIIAGLGASFQALLLVFAWRQAKERRRLHEIERRLTAFGEHAPVILYIRDEMGRYTHTNARFHDLLSEQPGDRNCRGANEFWLQINNADWLRSDQLVFDQKIVTSDVVELISAGSVRTYRVVRFPIYGDTKAQTLGIGGIGIDISAEVKARNDLYELKRTLEQKVAKRTQQLSELNQVAEAAVSEKFEMLATIAHEIRTPLSAISGLTFLIRQLDSNPIISGHLAKLAEAAGYLSAVVRNSLDFSRLEAGRLELESLPFSLREALNQVCELSWDTARSRNIDLLVEVPPSIPDQLRGDGVRLIQMLVNYVQNAIKYSRSSVIIIAVSVEFGGDKAVFTFEVRDYGIGINPRDLSRIFTRFEQSAHTRRTDGAGLGLSITRRIADLMGGRAWAKSTEGEGSSFYIRVPLDYELGELQDVALKLAPIGGTGIWLMEPSVEVAELLASQLGNIGGTVERIVSEHSQVADCLTNFSNHTPGILIVDWKLLVGSAVSSIQNLIYQTDTAVIVLTPPLAAIPEQILKLADNVALLFKPTAFIGLDSCAGSRLNKGVKKNSANYTSNFAGEINGFRILVAEDDEIIRSVIKEILAGAGALVTEAEDGGRARDQMLTTSFDVILMDLNMPTLSGVEVVQSMRQASLSSKIPPIIAMTASSSDNDQSMCAEVGMVDFITKPVDPSTLIGKIMRAVSTRRGQGNKSLADNAASMPFVEGIYTELCAIQRIDTEEILRRFSGRYEIWVKAVEHIVNRFALGEAAIQVLQRQLDDPNQIADALHRLAGELGFLGVMEMAREAAELEQVVRRSSSPPFGQIDRLKDDYLSLMEEIRRAFARGAR